MRTSTIILAWGLFLAALPAQEEAVRQSRSGRVKHAVLDATGVPTEAGLLRVAPNDTTTVCKLEWSDQLGAQQVVSVNLPFTRIGSLTGVGDRDYLVSGYTINQSGNPDKGYLVLIRLVPGTPNSIQTLASKEYTTFDAFSVSWNQFENRLYVLDSKNLKLWHASWTGTGATPALPAAASFAVAMDSQGSRDVKLALLRTTYTPNAQVGVVLTMGGCDPSGTRIYKDGLTWKVVAYSPGNGNAGAWGIQSSRRVPTKGQMKITGLGAYEITNEFNGSVVASGQLGTQNWTSINCPAAFDARPGELYTLSGGTLESLTFRPTVRYGAPMSSATFELGHGNFSPSKCTVGNPDLRLSYAIKLDQAVAQAEIWNVSLWVGLRDAVTGLDPVVVAGNVAVLQPVAVYDSTLLVPKDTPIMAPAVRFAIPSDSTLEESVLLWQVIVTRPGQATLASDVFGSTVFAAGAAQASKAGQIKAPTKNLDLRKALGLSGTSLSLKEAQEVKTISEHLIKLGSKNAAGK